MLSQLEFCMEKEKLFSILIYKKLGSKIQLDYLMLEMEIIFCPLFMLQIWREWSKQFMKKNLLENIFLLLIIIQSLRKKNLLQLFLMESEQV
jgi:hypothetical protein